MNIKMPAWALLSLCALVGLGGCASTKTKTVTQTSSTVVASTDSITVSVSSETTSVTKSKTPPPSPKATVDIFKDDQKPRSAVAVDAPKFVDPEEEQKRSAK